MKNLYKLAFILVIGSAFALAQAGAGQSPSTPSTPTASPSQSGAQQTPDNSQAGQPGAAANGTKAQSDIQSALRKQLPASADNVTVAVTDDNKVQLTGTVSSDAEKQQVEQIAHSAAPNMDIVNKLNVSSSSPSSPGSQPPTGSKPPVLRLVAYQATGSQDSPSTQTPATPSAGAQPGMQTGNSNDAQDKIQKALQGDSSLSGANITVTVADNKVELNGTVASRDQKKTARQIAESNAGGMKVVDHLKVSGSDATPSTPPKN